MRKIFILFAAAAALTTAACNTVSGVGRDRRGRRRQTLDAPFPTAIPPDLRFG